MPVLAATSTIGPEAPVHPESVRCNERAFASGWNSEGIGASRPTRAG